MPVSLLLNGRPLTLDASPDMPLLWAIREGAGITGTKITKYGCGVAQCGACTVHLARDLRQQFPFCPVEIGIEQDRRLGRVPVMNASLWSERE